MTIPAKPPHGAPCNGCGFCCRMELCPVAVGVLGDQPGPCPALQPRNGVPGFECGLVVNPERYAPRQTECYGASAMSQAALVMLGAGHGCDAVDMENGERLDPIFLFMSEIYAIAHHEENKRGAAMWGFSI